ncbi:uncharacterized protein L3040_000900 [Drepanopeziza brunnea f. sp. 'multigermtubi']|uniref:uncharacterized protein n=1 Tax=Drepanopeziza brunnea f. sp. 'multigermtubi' TaxID=698441 RepID=UPI00239E78D2|nr:hypothetical protein L3040_000900 [Drepanopeziza brunnea f. sp. 'multigermtubi']
MMFINNIVAIAIIAAASAVTSRTITLCDDPDFKNCQFPEARPNYCWDLVLGSDRTSSLDTKGAKCEFFVDYNCFPISGSFNYTGKIEKLFLAPGLEHFDDSISSFKCQ